MPITPLHFGLLAPINHRFPKKVSNLSFILVNLLIDGEAIHHWLFNMALPDHYTPTHTFLGAWGIAACLSLFWWSRQWALGAFLGATTHVFMDMLVHSDMNPVYPLNGNPFYMGWMKPLSLTLLPLTVWLIAQYVPRSLGWVRAKLEATKGPNHGPSS